MSTTAEQLLAEIDLFAKLMQKRKYGGNFARMATDLLVLCNALQGDTLGAWARETLEQYATERNEKGRHNG
jgi:hypothetical protein